MTQIAPGVYSMKQNKGGHVHAFLLDNGTDLTLIDTLFDTDARQILERIESIGRVWWRLRGTRLASTALRWRLLQQAILLFEARIDSDGPKQASLAQDEPKNLWKHRLLLLGQPPKGFRGVI
jgi:hypothetical protein